MMILQIPPSFGGRQGHYTRAASTILLVGLLATSCNAFSIHSTSFSQLEQLGSMSSFPTTRLFAETQVLKEQQQQQQQQKVLYIDATTNSNDIARQEVQSYRNQLYSSRKKQSTSQYQKKSKDVVMKFGGSSLANAERIDYVANLIKDQIESGIYHPRAIICSAMGKTTNGLLEAGQKALLEGKVDLDTVRQLHLETIQFFNMPESTLIEVTQLLDECTKLLRGVSLIQELSPKASDQLVSYGERCSVRIVAARLNQLGVPALALDAWDAGFCTNSDFGDAKILPECFERIQNKFNRIDTNIVAIVTGFIAHDNKKQVTTLGRSGSDLSATQLGAALNVDEIVFWKDVDGILSTDPRLVPNAIPISDVTYEQASELACFGAQVLHPVAMQPARKWNIPCRVKNSYNPQAEGTIIRNDINYDDTTTEGDCQRRLVTAITFKRDIKLMDFHARDKSITYGFLGQVFTACEEHKLSVDVLASSEVSISVTLDKKQENGNIQYVLKDLDDVAEIEVKGNKAIVTLIADVSRSSEVLADVFQVFAENNIRVEMISQGFSKVNISFIIDGTDLDRAVQLLHQQFFEQDQHELFNSIRSQNDMPVTESVLV